MKKSASNASLPEPEAVQRALAGAPLWVTPELIQHTLQVWQPFYDHQLIPEDALEIIMNVGHVFEALSSGVEHEAIRCPSSGEQP